MQSRERSNLARTCSTNRTQAGTSRLLDQHRCAGERHWNVICGGDLQLDLAVVRAGLTAAAPGGGVANEVESR